MALLEASKADVCKVFKSTRRDPLHKNIDRLGFERNEHRHFASWQMEFKNLDSVADGIEGFSRLLEPSFDVSDFQDLSSEAYRMLLAWQRKTLKQLTQH